MPAFTPPQPFSAPPGVMEVPEQVVYGFPPQMPGITTAPPAITTPSVPATTVPVTNTTGVDVNVYMACSVAGLSVTLNGAAMPGSLPANAPTDYYLPAGQTIILTYASGTVTWVWQAV